MQAIRNIWLAVLTGLVMAGLGLGCAEGEEAADDAGAALEELGSNVDDAAETAEDTYKKKRAAGEGPVEAAGEAYNAVLEEGR